MVALENHEPTFFYLLVELFGMCLKESCLPDCCWKILSVVHVFKNVGEMSMAKNYHPVSFLSVVNKILEKLVNNRLVEHLEKCGFFSYFQYDVRSSDSCF